ncbi:glycosyltransferase [Bradyrhizobium sp. McL0615]|uniref:glycosyltransferase n=1 Tax=Bradyrhizobium sp. McL0615 TaxID=3415673 RepID=UPI003CE941DB
MKALQGVRQTILNALLSLRVLASQNTGAAYQADVVFTGHLDDELKWASFAAAELFLLPSREKEFAITVVEAMQIGVPVVITDRVNTWPYVEEAGAALVLTERDINGLLPRD